jgi:competence protein ComEC
MIANMEDDWNKFNEESEPERVKKRNKRILLVAILLFVLAAIALFFTFINRVPADVSSGIEESTASVIEATQQPDEPAEATEFGEGLTVAFLDVGQGDSIFLQSPSGKTMLVDGGEQSAFDTVSAYLDAHDVIGLDVVVASHLHSDHIGGLIQVIDVYPVGAFYYPPFDAESEVYYDLLDALSESEAAVYSPLTSANSFIDWDEEVSVRILSPYEMVYSDFNDTSYILSITYGETSVLLTGDATELAEKLALKALPNEYFRADVLKVGHHGSNTSTSFAFLDAVDPDVAVISCGLDNAYGHPSDKLLLRLQAYGVQVYRTDLDGTVTLLLDGTNVKVIQ